MTRCAIVTGGASGIGLAAVKLFLADGVHVAIIDRDIAALEVVEQSGFGPGRLICMHADLMDLDRLVDVFDAAAGQLGQVDILVNSAALTGGTLDLLAVKADEMAQAYTLNATVPLILMQQFAKHVMTRGVNGRIVNLSSSSAFRARATRAAYGASKAALGALTRIAAAQLGPHDINVNAIAPGLTRTPALARAFPEGDAQLQAMVTEGPNANFLGRVSEADDIAQTVLFLCSLGARQITGQVVHVNAGAICL